MKSFKQHLIEANTMIHAAGSTVAFPHKGKMTTGKVVRYEKGGEKLAPHYVISHGETESAKVPPHKVEKYGIFNEVYDSKFQCATKTDVHYTGQINGKTWVVPHAFHGNHDVLHGTKVTPIRHSIVVSPIHVQHNNPTLTPEESARVHSHIKDLHGGQDPKRLGNLDESWLPMRGPKASKETPAVNAEHAKWEKDHTTATRKELKAARPMRTGAADRFLRRYGKTNEERQLALHLGMRKSDSHAPKPTPIEKPKRAPSAISRSKDPEAYQAERDKYRHAALLASRKAATLAFAKKHHIIHEGSMKKIADPFTYHQTQIAKKTLRMPDAMVGIMGGPNKEDSRKHLKKIGWTDKQLHDHEHAQFVQEHVWKVTDHMGHTHEVEAKDHNEAKKKTVSVGGVHPQGIPMTQWHKVRVERKNLEESAQLDERALTAPETAKKEEIVKSMKKKLQGFTERYGNKAKSVMYATATKQAKQPRKLKEENRLVTLKQVADSLTAVQQYRLDRKARTAAEVAKWDAAKVAGQKQAVIPAHSSHVKKDLKEEHSDTFNIVKRVLRGE